MAAEETQSLDEMMKRAEKILQDVSGGPMSGMGPGAIGMMPPPTFPYSITIYSTQKALMPKVTVHHVDAIKACKESVDLYEAVTSELRKRGFKTAPLDSS